MSRNTSSWLGSSLDQPLTNLQQDALAQAQMLPTSGVSGSASNGTTTTNLLLAQAEAFEHTAGVISQHFKSIAATLRCDYNSLQPVNRLPREVLVLIFEWCLDVDEEDLFRKDAAQLHRICAVCHQWKQLAEGSPNLWRYVSGFDPLQHVEKALKLSDPMPITVVYRNDCNTRVLESEFTAAVNLHVTRWSRAFVVYDDLDKAPQPWEGSELSKLHTLDIINNTSEPTRASIILGGGRELPNVRVVRLYDVPLRWDPGQLPGLRELELKGYEKPGRPPNTTQLLHLLMNTPRLKALRLRNVAIPADDAVQLMVTLPDLITLKLNDVPLGSIQKLLQSIQLTQSDQKSMDRNSIGHPASEECPNDLIDTADYQGDFVTVGFHDYQTHFSTGRFKLSAFPTLEWDAIECMEIVLRKFEKELAASEGIRADIGTPDGLSAATTTAILDKLDQLPNLRALRIIQSPFSSREAMQTVIWHLRRPHEVIENSVWHLPHLETISIDIQCLAFSELGAVCRERREAAVMSGYPKPIKELRISAWLQAERKSRLDHTIEEELNSLQDALGGGQLFWGAELWKTSRQKATGVTSRN